MHRCAFVLAACLVLFPAALHARDETLARAKDLYLAAAYDEALAVLDSLQAPAAGSAAEIAQYRIFCLLALERREDAKKAIEAVVATDPFYRPSDAQTSPRIRNVFQEIRKGVLPSVVQRAYADAKQAFDRKDPQAAALFDRVIAILDDPDVKGNAALADLRTVATGFRDLSKATAAAPPPAAGTPPPSPNAAAPADPAPKTSAAAARANADAPARDGDPGVVAPVTLSQRLPPWSPGREDRQREFSGTIEVIIDEQGAVISAAVRESVHPAYDAELLRVARSWKYKPATKNGAPTKYVKLVEVRLRPPTD
jgi:TonB family protein